MAKGYNPYRDMSNGRFASGPGGGVSAKDADWDELVKEQIQDGAQGPGARWRDALNSYIGEGYREINDSLRKGRPTAKARNLNDHIKKHSFDSDVVVRRGTGFGPGSFGVYRPDQAAELVGKVVTAQGILSTAAPRKGGAEVQRQHRYLSSQMKITVPKGSPALAAFNNAYEAEILLPHGTQMMVQGFGDSGIVDGIGNPIYEWDLVVVGTDG